MTGGTYSTNQQLGITGARLIHPAAPADAAPAALTEPPPPVVTLLPLSPPLEGLVTHYGEQFNGQPLGCGTGYYTSDNPLIAAVSPAHNGDWPCGSVIQVCGPGGCLDAVRHDGCPGCGPNQVDLSEAGIAVVCGGDDPSLCHVELQAFKAVWAAPADLAPPPTETAPPPEEPPLVDVPSDDVPPADTPPAPSPPEAAPAEP